MEKKKEIKERKIKRKREKGRKRYSNIIET